MSRQSKAASSVAGDFKLGKDFDLASWYNSCIVVDQRDQAYCFVGYRPDDTHPTLDYYSVSAASRSVGGRASYEFVRLISGCLVRSSFLHDEVPYRVLADHRLVLPQATQSYFGVVGLQDGRSEDADLTRKLFGGTMDEIETAAKALAHLIGRTGYDYPRLTFSKSRSNACDLTGALIPKDFPYLAFGASQYDWGHVSLYGFYRVLTLTAPKRSSLRQAIVGRGVEEDLIDRLVEAASNARHNHEPLMSRF